MAERPHPRRPSQAVEDYLKAVWALGEGEGAGRPVTTSRVAEALGVSAPSASNMLKRLAGMGFVSQDRRGVELTGSGRRVALEVVRHHRLLETYLATALGVPLDAVHAEAEVLEHHISEDLEQRIAEALGHPDFDPHGDPIPTPAGDVPPVPEERLSDLGPGERAVVARVSDRDPRLLRVLADAGVVPGAPVQVVAAGGPGGAVSLRVAGAAAVDIPHAAACAVNVE